MSTPPVPREIVDFVIDCAWELYCETMPGRVNPGVHRLVDGQEPFNVFALVSRSWVARSRHCAFRALTLRRKWAPDARQFAVLEHPLCTIREHVQQLHLSRSEEILNGAHDRAVAAYYVRRFVNLTDLGLSFLVFTAQSWDRRIVENVLWPNLQHLELRGCIFPSVECLIELIACATGLGSLLCSATFVDANGLRMTRSSPPRLTELSIVVEHDPCLAVLAWISSAPVPPRIVTLELQNINEKSIAVVSRALHVLGPSVVTLSLLFEPPYIASRQNQNLFATTADFSTLRNLRHLVTACFFSPHGGMGVEVPLILVRLAQNCKTVESITFRLRRVSAKEDILAMPWEAIVATLNGPSFRQLVRIAFELPPQWQRDATRDWLKENIGQQLLGNVTLLCRSDGDWSSS